MRVNDECAGSPAQAPAVLSTGRVGVVLVNLGTPESLETPAIRRFLAEFLADPRVVELPRIAWLPILYGLILPTRPGRIKAKYASVWMPEGSPLLVWSQRQVDGVRKLLTQRHRTIEVALAMRYGQPSLAQALDALRARGCARILVVPMYPQYSASTNATVFDAVARLAREMRDQPEFRFVQRFYDDPGYIAALADRVRQGWERQGRGQKLVLSFHGVPKRTIDLGDPYHAECLETGRLLARELGLSDDDYLVTFQSRFGAAEWLQPYTQPTLEALARDGVREVEVFCPGFVADCLETLEEIAQECAHAFVAAGGLQLRYLPALNDDPAWLAALAGIVERNLLGWNTDSAPIARENRHDPQP